MVVFQGGKPIPIAYTTSQAEGALINGARIEKTNSAPRDGHQDGALGIILGSLGPVEIPGFTGRYIYWVVWDAGPAAGLPVAIREGRIREAQA